LTEDSYHEFLEVLFNDCHTCSHVRLSKSLCKALQDRRFIKYKKEEGVFNVSFYIDPELPGLSLDIVNNGDHELTRKTFGND